MCATFQYPQPRPHLRSCCACNLSCLRFSCVIEIVQYRIHRNRSATAEIPAKISIPPSLSIIILAAFIFPPLDKLPLRKPPPDYERIPPCPFPLYLLRNFPAQEGIFSQCAAIKALPPSA